MVESLPGLWTCLEEGHAGSVGTVWLWVRAPGPVLEGVSPSPCGEGSRKSVLTLTLHLDPSWHFQGM